MAGERFDLVVSMATLILFLPVWALIALAVKLSSSGPVLYRDRNAIELTNILFQGRLPRWLPAALALAALLAAGDRLRDPRGVDPGAQLRVRVVAEPPARKCARFDMNC